MREPHESQDARHEPREPFVRRLEALIRAEVRRPGLVGWTPRLSRPAFVLAAVALVLVSMAIGGGAVAMAYQVQRSDLRDRLVAAYEQRVALASQRAALAAGQRTMIEQRVSIGIENQEALLDARQDVADAEAQLQSLELQLAEVRLTSREPLDAVSAPLVSGRDFVSERWRVELSVPQAAVERERRRLRAAEVRFDVGLAQADDVALAGVRLIEVETAIETIERKLAIRQAFLAGGMNAALAGLRVLEAEAEQRRTTLARRIDFGSRQMKDNEIRVEIGTLSPIDLAGERLRLQELQLAMTKAEYDLALIREQIRRQK